MDADYTYTPPPWLAALLATPPVPRMKRLKYRALMDEWDHDAAALPQEEDRR